MDNSAYATSPIVILSIAGVIILPLKLPEAIWAVLGKLLLLISGLLLWKMGIAAIGKGTDVYPQMHPSYPQYVMK